MKADLNSGKYSIVGLGGPVRLCGLGGWRFSNNPELVYDMNEGVWIGEADYTSGSFRLSINDSWGYTFGPKRAADLTVRDGSDIKIYHNDISKNYWEECKLQNKCSRTLPLQIILRISGLYMAFVISAVK